MILKMNLAAIAGTLLLALTPVALHAQEKETKTLEKRKARRAHAAAPKEESSSPTTPSKSPARPSLQSGRANNNAQERKGKSRKPSSIPPPNFRTIARIQPGPSPSFTMAVPAPLPFGCTWEPSDRAACSPPTPNPLRPRLINFRQCGTLLDKTDMVFIDPVGTGFSHAVGKAQDKDFWGVDQDVKSMPSCSCRVQRGPSESCRSFRQIRNFGSSGRCG